MSHLVSAFGGLGVGSLAGLLLSAWLAAQHEREKRRSDFVRQQLTEFYGPLVSMRMEILARSELRGEISAAARAAWQDGATYARQVGIEALAEFSRKNMPAVSAMTDDENRILREVLMPLYRDMLGLFRDRMWLAEPETRKYFKDFLRFIDIWERWLRETITGEVIGRLGHGEEALFPFYAHLANVHDRLQLELRDGHFSRLRVAWRNLRAALCGRGAASMTTLNPKQ